MNRMFIAVLVIILIIVTFFLFLYCDENTKNKRFLSSFGIDVDEQPYLSEEILIPEDFDSFHEDYNALQIESGLSLLPYKGKKAMRHTYRILNFPDKSCGTVYANVITVNLKPVAGDINCPALSGFILPLSAFSSYK